MFNTYMFFFVGGIVFDVYSIDVYIVNLMEKKDDDMLLTVGRRSNYNSEQIGA